MQQEVSGQVNPVNESPVRLVSQKVSDQPRICAVFPQLLGVVDRRLLILGTEDIWKVPKYAFPRLWKVL
jgi:hypothetical protein